VLTIFPFVLIFPLQRVEAGPRETYLWPVQGTVVRPFAKPKGAYGEGGHQGMDIACQRGSTVTSAAAGVVEWIGEVPRGRFVTVAHEGNVRTTYLDLERIDVAAGQRLVAGQVIGSVFGARDNSSSEPHLHFDAYIDGVPVDPNVLFDGLSAESFVRLCPVAGCESSKDEGSVRTATHPGFLSRLGRDARRIAGAAVSPLSVAWRGLKTAAISIGSGFSRAAGWFGRSSSGLWNSYIYPALCSTGRACAWVWRNRFVEAVVAGLTAAVVVVAAIIAAMVVLSLSLAVALVAAVAAVIASIACALIYAAKHAGSFCFATCLFKSICAGGLTAGLICSAGSISGAFASGWAELGLSGLAKGAFWSGFYSLCFEAGTSYLFTSHISWQRMLIAFCAGAVSGAIGRTIIHGIRSSTRVAEIFEISFVEARTSLMEVGRTIVLTVREGTEAFEGVLVVLKHVALKIGTRIAYLAYSGTFATGLSAAFSAVSGKPITLSGLLAAFCAGVVMGSVALSFDIHGFDGMLGRLAVFRDGFGEKIRGFTSMLVSKTAYRGLNSGFKQLFGKLFKEEAAK
jgi:hypothetical protein